MRVRVVNDTRGSVLAEEAVVARTFGQRLKGLLLRRNFPPGTGLVIEPCQAIHTFFMLFPIDAVFYDHNGRVVALYTALGPFRLTHPVKAARGVVELPVGMVAATKTGVGDHLTFLVFAQ